MHSRHSKEMKLVILGKLCVLNMINDMGYDYGLALKLPNFLVDDLM